MSSNGSAAKVNWRKVWKDLEKWWGHKGGGLWPEQRSKITRLVNAQLKAKSK